MRLALFWGAKIKDRPSEAREMDLEYLVLDSIPFEKGRETCASRQLVYVPC